MDESKVTFDKTGAYSFGTPLSEMDVHREASGAADEGGAGVAPPPPARAASTGTKTPKKFNLDNLKKKTGTSRSKKTTKKEEPAPPPPVPPVEEPPAPPAEPPKAEEPPALPVETPKPEEPSVAEPPADLPEEEGTVSPLDIDPNYPPRHVPGGDPPIPAYQPDEPLVEEPAPESKPAEAFKLAQLGLSAQRTPEEPEPVAPASASASASAVKEMNLEATGKAEDSVPKAEEKPQAPAPVAENKETEATAPEFVFHKLPEFLEVAGLEVGQLTAFIKAVVKASFRGSAIWESKANAPLRAYSCVVPVGRAVPTHAKYLVTLGWDVHVTTCYISGNYEISDGSSQLKCVGICAYVQGTPVALSMERKRNAVVL